MVKKGSIIGILGAVWGLLGVLLLLTSATYRLAPLAIEAFSYELSLLHWVSLVVVVFGMAYAEGYRGFQQGFSPRVAARAKYLKEHPRPLHVVLAPFFCMGYFHATRRRQITSISLTLGIIILVLLVRLIDQPWRGIIDAGVVVGLAWGIITVAVFGLLAFLSESYDSSPEVPGKAVVQ
jgi:hypothetical protein